MDSVYKVVEVNGTSKKSWEDAGANAVKTASKILKDLHVAEIIKLDMALENGKVVSYRARVSLSLKYLSSDKYFTRMLKFVSRKHSRVFGFFYLFKAHFTKCRLL